MAKVETWHQLKAESDPAYTAFRVFLEIGPGRSIHEAARREDKSQQLLSKWANKHDWRGRALDFDNSRRAVEDDAQRKEIARRAREWVRRRTEEMEYRFDLSRRIYAKVEEMLRHPLTAMRKKTIDPKTGQPIEVTIVPVKWTLATAAGLTRVGANLANSAITDAMEVQDDFDPATASLEECRAYLQRIQEQRQLPFEPGKDQGDAEGGEEEERLE